MGELLAVKDVKSEASSKMPLRRRVAAVAMAAAAMLGVTEAVSPGDAHAASAPSCYGDYCSGKYANETGCDQDATTAVEQPLRKTVYDYGASSDGINAQPRQIEVGTLQVRKSDRCGTEWARVIINVPTQLQSVELVQDVTHYTQTHYAQNDVFESDVTGTFFTPQIYTHDYQSQAHAYGNGIDEASAYSQWAPPLRSN